MARFPAALTPEYDVREFARHPETQPGLQRKHVFDSGDGVRMVASIGFDDRDRALHLSFSLQPAFVSIFTRKTYRQRVMVLVRQFAKPNPLDPTAYYQSTPRGVDHFLFKLPAKP